MSKNHTLNTKEINPKVANYQTNGTGRDTYIRTNNGGFTKSSNGFSLRQKIISI